MRALSACAVAASLDALGQPEQRVKKLGILNALPREAPLPQAILRGLRDLGYVEGRNLLVDYRSGPYDDFPALAADLVNAKVDVIYAVLDQAALAASKTTTTIPIVFAVLGDPVRAGLIASLAHPGGNLTGLTAFSSELGGKRVELLKQLLPALGTIGVLWNPPLAAPDARTNPAGLEKTAEAARAMDVEVRSLPVRRPTEIDAVLETATRERLGGLIVEEDSITYAERDRIIRYAAAHRLPAIYGYRDYVASGGLMSYGARLPDLLHGLLEYIDRILKGARPGDLPVRQPSSFELVINAEAARQAGLSIPQALLLRADEVIQ